MRDVNRIDAFCQRLAAAWKTYVPDQRFGQFMTNVFGGLGRDPFFYEEEEMIREIEAWAILNSPYYKPPKSRLDILQEKFPKVNSIYDGTGICVNNIFGEGTEDCDNFTGTCKECWMKAASDEYQDKEDE